MLAGRVTRELHEARVGAGLSLATIARELGLDPSTVWRLEAGQLGDVSVVRLSEIASVLGYEISLGLHPVGDPVRDKAQLAIGLRFERLLSARWQVRDEALLPGQGEQRAWDKLLRLTGIPRRHLIGVDIESRIWDVQAIVRRTRARERDGGVDAILIVLADSAHNRRVVDRLRDSLGDNYRAPPRQQLAALRKGTELRGGGVILI